MCSKLAPNRVALLVAEGLEEIEGLTVVDLLFRAGIPCDTISIVPERTVTSSHKVTIVCDRSLADEDFSFADYGLIVLPGGVPGTPNLAACKPLTDELCRRMAADEPVAAICAAPSVLGRMGMLRGRKATCFPGFEKELEGAEYTGAHVETDGNVITAKGAGCALTFGHAIVSYAVSKEEADKVLSDMQCF